jgi:hypothetical protein
MILLGWKIVIIKVSPVETSTSCKKQDEEIFAVEASATDHVRHNVSRFISCDMLFVCAHMVNRTEPKTEGPGKGDH